MFEKHIVVCFIILFYTEAAPHVVLIRCYATYEWGKKKRNADQRPMKKLLFQVSTTPTSYAGAEANAFRMTFFHYLVFEPEPRYITRYTGLLGM